MEQIKGQTNTGFEYTLDPEKLDNYDLTEAIAAVEVDGNSLMFPTMLRLLLGEEQAKALKEHVRNDDGVIKHELLMKEIADIFANNSMAKK